MLGEARPGEFVCLVGDGPGLSAVRAHRADGRAEVLPPRQRLVAPPGTRLLELVFGSHRLDVTAVAGHVAAVVFAGAELRVSYFDSALVRDETTLLRLDRAQRLLAAGRDEAARLVLRWLGRAESEVAARLLEALPGVTERYRVRGCAYPVYLDRPVTDPR